MILLTDGSTKRRKCSFTPENSLHVGQEWSWWTDVVKEKVKGKWDGGEHWWWSHQPLSWHIRQLAAFLHGGWGPDVHSTFTECFGLHSLFLRLILEKVEKVSRDVTLSWTRESVRLSTWHMDIPEKKIARVLTKQEMCQSTVRRDQILTYG